jgi:1,4-dihydroxy-2-naphthoyl-CoA hydrolase
MSSTPTPTKPNPAAGASVFRTATLEAMNAWRRNMSLVLDIEVTAVGDDWLEGTMPVDKRTRQPFGVLHGGASCVLAESLGSIASNAVLDNSVEVAVGQSITANHLRPVTDGLVTGRARAVHLGRRSHVWDIEIRDERERLVCVSRLTTAVVPTPGG